MKFEYPFSTKNGFMVALNLNLTYNLLITNDLSNGILIKED
ncbi:MAG: hypothetical protein K0S67_127 [Nitrososphaeraceae archaeon]|jgi:hypothetical protein|nr:hypothetical protein [Nitrososphaeraceae archaeon]